MLAQVKAYAMDQLRAHDWILRHKGKEGHSDHDSMLVDVVAEGIDGEPQVPNLELIS